MDDKGSVLDAGSKEDMNMGEFRCILHFDMSADMTSATCHAIYEENGDSDCIVKDMFVL